MSSTVKTAVFWVVLICVAVLLWAVVKQTKTPKEQALLAASRLLVLNHKRKVCYKINVHIFKLRFQLIPNYT